MSALPHFWDDYERKKKSRFVRKLNWSPRVEKSGVLLSYLYCKQPIFKCLLITLSDISVWFAHWFFFLSSINCNTLFFDWIMITTGWFSMACTVELSIFPSAVVIVYGVGICVCVCVVFYKWLIKINDELVTIGMAWNLYGGILPGRTWLIFQQRLIHFCRSISVPFVHLTVWLLFLLRSFSLSRVFTHSFSVWWHEHFDHHHHTTTIATIIHISTDIHNKPYHIA